MKTCDECKNCLLHDFGYSNYTVEGTEVHCMLNLHPNEPFDRWYGEDGKLLFADKCDGYANGAPQVLDVDSEDYDELSEQAKEYLS